MAKDTFLDLALGSVPSVLNIKKSLLLADQDSTRRTHIREYLILKLFLSRDPSNYN